MSDTPRVGGIVLCGGASSRMGLPKAMLPFGPESMLQRVVRLLSKIVDPVVVVAAAGQPLPELPSDILVARDEQACRGPLEGLRVGLAAIARSADAAYATSCDVPLLADLFVRRMIAELGHHDAAVPVDGELFHPLAAVYRTRTLPTIAHRVERKQLRITELVEALSAKRVPVVELRHIDSDLLTLMNVNTPSDYLHALQLAGLLMDLGTEGE